MIREHVPRVAAPPLLHNEIARHQVRQGGCGLKSLESEQPQGLVGDRPVVSHQCKRHALGIGQTCLPETGDPLMRASIEQRMFRERNLKPVQ